MCVRVCERSTVGIRCIEREGKRGRGEELAAYITAPPHIAPHIEKLFRLWEKVRLGNATEELERAVLAVDSSAGQEGVAKAAIQDYDNRIRPDIMARRGS